MPRLSAAITQEECLYDDRWTKEADNLFIDLLMEANSVGDWKYGRPANSVFDYCRLGIKAALDLNFSLCDVELRFDFLHKRYSVFRRKGRKIISKTKTESDERDESIPRYSRSQRERE
ncbi:aspartate carbamoyltransferase [Striga asiatica]|uniref:Aspartate carbamoyltransferase n=1 Tax=Striga asiatica TaxID=4170 RepID=A0A5A7PS69_STRAF|nr:aspartate carbamoyltransferase [Striga asiatica]